MIKWLYILLCCILYSCKPLQVITDNNNNIAKSNGVVVIATYSNGYVLDSLGKIIATYSNGYILNSLGKTMATYSNGYVLDSLGKVIATYNNGYVCAIHKKSKNRKTL